MSKKNIGGKPHLKKNDVVIALNGEDAAGGKTGKILQVLVGRNMAIVEGFNMVKRHMRKTQDNPQGGIVEKEAPLPMSKLKRHEGAKDKTKKVAAS